MSTSTTAVTAGSGTEAAERVADVLLVFASDQDSMGVSAIARKLSLSKAVVHRILQSLVSRGLVKFSPTTREYSLGTSAVLLGARALNQLDVRDAARDELIGLRIATQETTTLSMLIVDKRTYVDQYESPLEIKMTVELGKLHPLHAGASSRAILAFLSPEEIDRVIAAGLPPLTAATVRDAAELRHRLDDIRLNGFATSRGERQADAGSVAAPVFGLGGRIMGSISVCGPLARFDAESVERYVPLVEGAARRLSQRFSGL